MRIGWVIVWSFFTGVVCGQNWEARITDSDTGEPIPFANIGIVGKDAGAVSDESGFFKMGIALSKYLGDTLRCSVMGYCSKDFILSSDFILPTQLTLEACPLSLPEISVLAKDFKKQKTLGHTSSSRKIVFFFMSNKLGTELATRIEVKKGPAYVLDANFNIAENKFGTILFRVNLYDLDPVTNLPGKNLMPEELIVEASKNHEKISVDLRPYNIVAERDFILSLEWIKALDGGKITEDLKFCAALTSKSDVYIKKTSQSNWKLFEEKRMGFKIGVAFYVNVKY